MTVGIVLGIVFFLMFLEFFVSPTSVRCDRLTNTFVFRHKHFWQREYREEKLCDVRDVKCAKLDRHVDEGTTMYSTVLELYNGESIAVFNSASSDRKEHEKEVKIINDFLQYKTGQINIKDNNIIIMVLSFVVFLTFTLFGVGIYTLLKNLP